MKSNYDILENHIRRIDTRNREYSIAEYKN